MMSRAVAFLLLLAVRVNAQITIQAQTVGAIINYYASHGDLQGDTNYGIQGPATYASGASAGTSILNLNDGVGNRTISGKIFFTFNDGISTAGNSNIGIYNLNVLDMSSAANTTAVATNQMADYGTQGATDSPAGWGGQRTIGVVTAGTDADWKSGQQISVNGWIILPNQRQDRTPYYSTGDSTLNATPDGGMHWCNPYTFANRTGGVGCDAINWSATGDAPKAPSDPSYTASPSSIMWKDVTPFDGTTNRMGRIHFFEYCQDNSCTGSPHGADTYLYGFGATGRQTAYILFRVLKNINSIMDVSAYQYYTCAGYSPAHICDGTDSANWTSTLANATTLFVGVGAAANGTGTSINQIGNTNQMGSIYGAPKYYCANGGCAYVMPMYQQYLTTGSDHSAIAAFPTPWGPFTPTTGEFSNLIAGFWSFLRYTISTPDSQPYHAKFVMVGDSYSAPFQTTNSSAGFQLYELSLAANQAGNVLSGCTPYRFSWGAAVGSIIRNGLWAYFDFFSHGCFDHRVGNIYYPSMFANDISVYPPTKQFISCFTDGSDNCGNYNSTHGIYLTTDSWAIEDKGYVARGELTDTVPGVYNRLTLSPFNATFAATGVGTLAADPAWTSNLIIHPTNVGTVNQTFLQQGPSSHLVMFRLGSPASGKIAVYWEYSGGTVSAASTNAVISSGVWSYVTISKSPGAVTVCSAVPCTATVHMYINGAEVPLTRTGTGTPDMQAAKLQLGAWPFTLNYTGSVAGAGFYTRVQSADEIAHNYATHKTTLKIRGITLP